MRIQKVAGCQNHGLFHQNGSAGYLEARSGPAIPKAAPEIRKHRVGLEGVPV